MNIDKDVMLFAFLSIDSLISVTDMFSINIFAQPLVKEILIGPDSSEEEEEEEEEEDIYNPNDITINKGDKVMWINNDFGIHTVTENQGLFSSKYLRPVQAFEYTFEAAGIYDYHCRLHPEMTGKITVI